MILFKNILTFLVLDYRDASVITMHYIFQKSKLTKRANRYEQTDGRTEIRRSNHILTIK